MTTTLFLSMAAFALAASISPGPVNIVALSSGAQYGFRPSLRHVSGATLGFTLLLVLGNYINLSLEMKSSDPKWLEDKSAEAVWGMSVDSLSKLTEFKGRYVQSLYLNLVF